MTLSQDLKLVRSRLCYLGITASDCDNLLLLFQKWSEDNGLEWSVLRFKAVYSHVSKHFLLNGSFKSVPPLPYFRQHRNKKSGGTEFAGIIGRVISSYKWDIVLQALRFYTFFRAKKETASQLRKFYSSMQKDKRNLNTPRVLSCIKRIHSILEFAAFEDIGDVKFRLPPKLRRRLFSSPTISSVRLSEHGRIRDAFNDIVKRTPFLADWCSSNTRRAPILCKENGRWKIVSKVESTTTLDQHLETFGLDTRWLDFQSDFNYSNHEKTKVILPVVSEVGPIKMLIYRNHLDQEDFNPIKRDCVGKISFIQEAGFKLRAVANPFRVLQAMTFGPSEKIWTLVKLLDHLCVSYVFNQEDGIRKVHAWTMSPGDELFSVDLSDATNHFPWWFQRQILSKILTEVEINLLDKISSGSWLCPDGRFRHFSVGQPLGAYFSFAALSSCHTLMAMASMNCSLDDYQYMEDHLAVVGDDIVIKGRENYLGYMSLLRDLDMPISEDKSVTSRYSSEFLSKLFYRTHRVDTFKWGEVNEGNIFSVVSLFPQLSMMASVRDRPAIQFWMTVPEPIGLGINPKGLSFDQRLPGELKDMWLDANFGRENNFSIHPSAPIPHASQMFQSIDSLIEEELSCDTRDWLTALNVLPDRDHTFLSTTLPNVSFNLLRSGMLTSGDIISLKDRYPLTSRLLDIVLRSGYTARSPIPSKFKRLNFWKKMYRRYAES